MCGVSRIKSGASLETGNPFERKWSWVTRHQGVPATKTDDSVDTKIFIGRSFD
jgi:hypothetical protein